MLALLLKKPCVLVCFAAIGCSVTGNSPLLGHNIKEFGPRFPPMSQAYDRGLQKLAFDTAQELGYGEFTRRGVYAMVAG